MMDQRLSADPRQHARVILGTVGFECADQTIANNILQHSGAQRRYWIEVHAALWSIVESARTRPAPTEE